MLVQSVKALGKGRSGYAGSGLLGLHVEVTPAGKSSTTSRNWLTPGGAVSSASARPQMSKYQKHIVNTCYHY